VTWLHPVAVKQVELDGTIASFAVSGWLVTLFLPFQFSQAQVAMTIFSFFAGTPADCTSLGISRALFPTTPDLVVSGINKGSNCGYHMYVAPLSSSSPPLL